MPLKEYHYAIGIWGNLIIYKIKTFINALYIISVSLLRCEVLSGPVNKLRYTNCISFYMFYRFVQGNGQIPMLSSLRSWQSGYVHSKVCSTLLSTTPDHGTLRCDKGEETASLSSQWCSTSLSENHQISSQIQGMTTWLQSSLSHHAASDWALQFTRMTRWKEKSLRQGTMSMTFLSIPRKVHLPDSNQGNCNMTAPSHVRGLNGLPNLHELCCHVDDRLLIRVMWRCQCRVRPRQEWWVWKTTPIVTKWFLNSCLHFPSVPLGCGLCNEGRDVWSWIGVVY